jgi:uncharacterized membrane protein HdeD (DUF308 family)
MQQDADPQSNRSERPAEAQAFAVKYWWLNVIRGSVALLIGMGLLLPVEVFLKVDQLHTILFQFVGIYFLVSGIMSLVFGLSNHRQFGLWFVAGVLGLVGGFAFLLRSILESHFSADVLTLIFGLIMALAGLIHILGGFHLGETFGRRWTRGHFFLGLVEIGIGFLILLSIFVPVDNLRIMLSFWGLVAGVGLIAEGLGMRKRKNTQGESEDGQAVDPQETNSQNG